MTPLKDILYSIEVFLFHRVYFYKETEFSFPSYRLSSDIFFIPAPFLTSPQRFLCKEFYLFWNFT